MEVNLKGVLRQLLNFGSLLDGETFVYRDEPYIKTGEAGMDIENGITCQFERDMAVHKVNLKVVVDEGIEHGT